MAENAQPALPHNKTSLSSSLNQLSILVGNIKKIFHSVEPDTNNMMVYGHLIRNTLLLAAMEFGNECKGVLTANGYAPLGGPTRWSTVDFVKVLQPLRLTDMKYSLAIIHRYPAARRSQVGAHKQLPNPCPGMMPTMPSSMTESFIFLELLWSTRSTRCLPVQ
jgi:hypothetical protein